VRRQFEQAGIAGFAREREGMDALVQFADHAALMGRTGSTPARVPPIDKTRFLNEAESLAMLASVGIPVIEHRLCRSEDEVRSASAALGPPIVIKACSPDVPHKSDHGLVALNPADPVAEFQRQRRTLGALGAKFEGAIVARMAPKDASLRSARAWIRSSAR